MGKGKKLTPEIIQEVRDLVAAGNYLNTVRKKVGIPTSAWYRWMKEGEKEVPSLERGFFLAIDQANAEAEAHAVAAWMNAFKDDWRAAKEFLARRFRDRWGPAASFQTTKDGDRVIVLDPRPGLRDDGPPTD